MNIYQKILNKVDCIYNTYKSKSVKTMKGVEVLSFEQSIDTIVNNKSSLARYGDGELLLMLNKTSRNKKKENLRFQRVDENLQNRLIEIIQSQDLDKFNLKLAISSPILDNNLKLYTNEGYYFWNNFLKERRHEIYKLIKSQQFYLDTYLSRFYMDFRDKGFESMNAKVKRLKTIWEGEDILIIEGRGSALGVNNDLFNNVKSICRILGPDVNAFDSYDEILEAGIKYGQNKTIILALGPTATVLAYDFARLGMRALDLGHIDIEYEWFLLGATEKVKVRGKVMTEVMSVDSDKFLDDIKLLYLSQIVYTVN